MSSRDPWTSKCQSRPASGLPPLHPLPPPAPRRIPAHAQRTQISPGPPHPAPPSPTQPQPTVGAARLLSPRGGFRRVTPFSPYQGALLVNPALRLSAHLWLPGIPAQFRPEKITQKLLSKVKTSCEQGFPESTMPDQGPRPSPVPTLTRASPAFPRATRSPARRELSREAAGQRLESLHY